MVNLFLVGPDAVDAVAVYCDAHVVKMTSECCQILCTILHHWDFWEHINSKFPLWKPAYVKHPVVFWAQASINSATLVARYGQCLLDEYTHRYGKKHEAFNAIATCCAVIVKIMEGCVDLAPDDPARIRPTFLNKHDLVAAARKMYGDAYADKLAPKVFNFSCSADREAYERGYYHAAVCAFSLSVPGRSKAFNDKLTADLYACAGHIQEVMENEEDEDEEAVRANMAGIMHGLYYACKIYIGFGTQRKPLSWWGEVGSIPIVVAKFLPDAVERVFLPNMLLPAVTGPHRRLPTSKCLPFDAATNGERAPMVPSFPDIAAFVGESDDETLPSDDAENAAPNPRKQQRSR